jgi:phosphatidylglycerophosphatase A
MATLEKKSRRSTGDRLALLIATGLGSGYSPVAPGTAGAIVGVGVFLASRFVERAYGVKFFALGVCWVLIFLGIWASARAAKFFATKDPRQVVIDEIAGQFIALLLTPGLSESLESGLIKKPIYLSILCFAFFRLFDIVKPYPIKKLENLKSGLGVMADDVMAGVYAGIVLHVSWFVSHLYSIYR